MNLLLGSLVVDVILHPFYQCRKMALTMVTLHYHILQCILVPDCYDYPFLAY